MVRVREGTGRNYTRRGARVQRAAIRRPATSPRLTSHRAGAARWSTRRLALLHEKGRKNPAAYPPSRHPAVPDRRSVLALASPPCPGAYVRAGSPFNRHRGLGWCGYSAGRGGQLQSPQKGPITARPVRLERPALCFLRPRDPNTSQAACPGSRRPKI
jgi:hypothetical protein